MKINIENILESNSKNFNWQFLPENKFYKAKIVKILFLDSNFSGEMFKIIFEVLDKDFLGINISFYANYKNKYKFIHSDFIDFISNFIDLEKIKDFDTENLIEEKCNIFVENNEKNKHFQKITKINTIFGKEN